MSVSTKVRTVEAPSTVEFRERVAARVRALTPRQRQAFLAQLVSGCYLGTLLDVDAALTELLGDDAA